MRGGILSNWPTDKREIWSLVRPLASASSCSEIPPAIAIAQAESPCLTVYSVAVPPAAGDLPATGAVPAAETAVPTLPIPDGAPPVGGTCAVLVGIELLVPNVGPFPVTEVGPGVAAPGFGTLSCLPDLYASSVGDVIKTGEVVYRYAQVRSDRSERVARFHDVGVGQRPRCPADPGNASGRYGRGRAGGQCRGRRHRRVVEALENLVAAVAGARSAASGGEHQCRRHR